MSYDAPFAGLKVIDLSQGIAGPYCGMLLAQQGAQLTGFGGPMGAPPGAGPAQGPGAELQAGADEGEKEEKKD